MERKPTIIAETIARSPTPALVRPALEALAREIAALPIAPPPEDSPLQEAWATEYGQWQGRTWLEVPWYFAEACFYLRLLSATGYYRGAHPDPFGEQKAELLARCGALLPSLADTARGVAALSREQAFTVLARRSLWGNRVDLSYVALAERHAERHHRLEDLAPAVDDCARAFALLQRSPRPHVTFLCDNSGPEILADLHLVDWLLSEMGASVVLEVKPQPFFVSDVMTKEVTDSVRFLAGAEEREVIGIGGRLKDALADGRLLVRHHDYWCGPGHYRCLPGEVADRLAGCTLVISKGDVNYRRFLEDRHWPFHTPIERAVGSFPVPALLLRTFKGELAAGLSKDTVQRLAAEDADWLTSGRQGVAQLVVPAPR